jgi:transcriptional/translational regulatory protein YebC/TACO1
VITVEVNNVDAEELALFAIDAGADDVHTQPEDMEEVRRVLEEKGIEISAAELLRVPKTMIRLDEKSALQSLKLLDKLEELDDVQHVFTNADFPDEVVENYQG